MDIIAILVTIIGALLILAEAGILESITAYNGWIIAVIVLVIGIGKLLKKI